MKVKSQSEVAQSCPTLSDPTDCSLPGSSVHGIFQAMGIKWNFQHLQPSISCFPTGLLKSSLYKRRSRASQAFEWCLVGGFEVSPSQSCLLFTRFCLKFPATSAVLDSVLQFPKPAKLKLSCWASLNLISCGWKVSLGKMDPHKQTKKRKWLLFLCLIIWLASHLPSFFFQSSIVSNNVRIFSRCLFFSCWKVSNIC